MNQYRKLAPHGLAFLLVGVLVLFSPDRALSRSIRDVEADDSSVTLIHTAMGYSTILEFQSKPSSAVLGDQDSFKLEYVGNSITIKPLAPHAKSNVFIFTDYDRFNCQLVSGPPAEVDYIVRIRTKIKSYPIIRTGAAAENPIDKAEPDPFVTRPVQKSESYDGFRLTLVSIAHERDFLGPRAVTLIDFELLSRKLPYSFQPRSIGVKQTGKFLDLESLYLDSLALTPGERPVHGKLALLSQDFKPASSVTLVFAVPKSNDPRSAHLVEVSTMPITKPKPKPKLSHNAGTLVPTLPAELYPMGPFSPVARPNPTSSPGPTGAPDKKGK